MAVRATSERNSFSGDTITLEVVVEPEVNLTGPVAVIVKSGDVEPASVNFVVEMELQKNAKLSTSTISRILRLNGRPLRMPRDGPNKLRLGCVDKPVLWSFCRECRLC